jgi:hypothetical protein
MGFPVLSAFKASMPPSGAGGASYSKARGKIAFKEYNILPVIDVMFVISEAPEAGVVFPIQLFLCLKPCYFAKIV